MGMNNPSSQPTVQPQPNQEFYGIDSLALFQAYTRDTYREAFGSDAAPWDPSRRTKTWFDSTVESSQGNPAAYKVVGQDSSGTWGLRPMTMPAIEAATVNLPGAIAYPVYVIQPTNATRGGTPINPLLLSVAADASAMMTTLGGAQLVDQGVAPVYPVVYPQDEPRRMWGIVLSGGIQENVGALLQMRNSQGVGAPGHWDLNPRTLAWIPDPPAATGLHDPRPPSEMPVRDLLPNEVLQPGVMGFGVRVVRTDLQLETMKRNGAFLSDDRLMLSEIYRIITSKPGL